MAGRLGITDAALGGRRRAGGQRTLAVVPPDDAASTPNGDAVASVPAQVPARIPLASVAPHPMNPRGRVTGGVDELAASIRELGVLEPVIVASREAFHAARPALVDQIPETARWVLIAGERRLAAAMLAGLAEIPAVTGNHLMAQAVDIEAMVVENIQRENLTALQEARAFESLTRDGLSQRTIAKRVGRNQSHITRRLSLLRVPADALAQVEDGTLAIAEALTLAAAKDADVIEQAWSLMQRAGMDAHRSVGRIVAERERERERAEAIQRARARAQAEGTRLLDGGTDEWTGDYHELDTDAVEAARAAGTLVAEATPDGLIYYDTNRTDDPARPAGQADDWRARQAEREAAEREKERTRKAANKARRAAAAVLAGKPPSPAGLAEHLVAYAINTANHETIRVAGKLAGAEGDPYTWRRGLDGATAAERRRAAWAICLAHRDLNAASPHHRWGPDEADYLDLLATGGYEITDEDRARLATSSQDTDDESDTDTDEEADR